MQGVASQNAPSPSLVVPHFLLGGFTLLIIAILIVFYPEAFIGHYFNPKLLGITHLLVLGWITMVIFGALYQVIPVILEVKLYSERLGFVSLVLLVSGSLLLALAFWRFELGLLLYVAASLVTLAAILFAINIFVTSSRSVKRSIERDLILTSILWLLFTVLAGGVLGLNLTMAFLATPHLELLKMHAHAGIAGWFLQLIMGVGSRLLPMFMVSHGLRWGRLRAAYGAVNGGLLVGVFALILQWRPGVLAGTLIVLAGIVLFLSFLWDAYRKRVKKQLDIGMRQSALSFLILLLPLALVLLLSPLSGRAASFSAPMALAYGSALLLGFITSLIMGQTYKTLPFILWLKVYRNKVGKGKIPLPKDLYDERIANMQLWTYAAGFFTLLTGIFLQWPRLITVGAALLCVSVVFYNFNLLKIVLHKPVAN